jgi:hypothetical protein
MTALVLLLCLAIAGNQFQNQTVTVVLVAISLGIAANLLTQLIGPVSAALIGWLSTSRTVAKKLLEKIYEELTELDKLPRNTGRFYFGYEHVIYSPKSMQAVAEYIIRFRNHLVSSSVDDNSPYEAALLALFAGYSSEVVDCLERKFHDLTLPEFTRLADKAGSNILFQQIVLTLALGKYFPGRATNVVRRIYKASHKTYYGAWTPHAKENFQKAAIYANADELLITYHIGNAYQPLEIFNKIENQMNRVDFYFIHPCILSRQALLSLGAELGAPAILKKEVGFLHTANHNYQIDFVRKVFQLLSNVREITELSSQRPDLNVRIFFFDNDIPSVCLQIVRGVGYVFVIPAAFDNSKFLSRFTIEINDKEITEEFVKLVDQEMVERATKLQYIRKGSLLDTSPTEVRGRIENFSPNKSSFERLCSEAINELAVFLKANRITKVDVDTISPQLMLSLSGDIAFNKTMLNELLKALS